MRLTSARGLAVRALLAAAVNGGVLLASAVFVMGFGAFLAFYVVPIEVLGGWALVVPLAVGALVALVAFGRLIRETIRAERRALLDRTDSLSDVVLEDEDELEAAVNRLATQFDLPEPSIRIHRSRTTPLAYSTYRPADPVVRTGSTEPVLVVSAGVVASLSPDEREAVLAHELAHLANDDLRLVTWVLVPLVAAEEIYGENARFGIFSLISIPLAHLARVGVGVFSRGRELTADRAAATATGDPGALAAALETLAADAPAKPREDFRKHAASANAVNVLPTLDPDRGERGLRATHPPLATRLRQLRDLAEN